MEALKLAFDTLIVGALALPWLAIVIRILAHGAPSANFRNIGLLSLVPEGAKEALAGVLLIAVGYLLGSSMSRVASDVFNDEFWHATPLPTEDEIREAVYCEQDGAGIIDWKRWPQQAADFELGRQFLCENGKRNPTTANDDQRAQLIKAQAAVLTAFRLQESAVLLTGEDKADLLRRYNEQSVILRGGALNGFMLCALCIFGLCADLRGHLRLAGKLLAFVPAALVLLMGGYLVYQALKNPSEHSYADPPLAEAVLTSIGLIGFFVPPADPNSRLYSQGFALGLVLSLILYGAWWWTEVIYDQSVVYFFHVLSAGPAAG